MKLNQVKLLRNKYLIRHFSRFYSTCKKKCNKKKSDDPKNLRCCKDDSKRFIKECFIAAKVSPKNAEQQADLLIAADLRGHYSHGMNRLEYYLNEIDGEICCGKAEPQILKETPAIALVDGCNGLGAVTGNFCMQLAIKKAQKVGIGYVVAKGGCHFGMAAYYSMQAMDKCLIGYASCNTSPVVAPVRAKEGCLGTNPLSLAIPSSEKEKNIVIDMATTTTSLGKIELAQRAKKKIPENWALGTDGKPTTDPDEALKAGSLTLLGGGEKTGGYKGYCLGCMVEGLGALLSGADFLSKVACYRSTKRPSNLGFTFMALQPTSFAPGFPERVDEYMCMIRHLEPSNKKKKVLIPGDVEKAARAKIKKEGGLYYVPSQLEACKKLSEKYKIKMIKPFMRKDKRM